MKSIKRAWEIILKVKNKISLHRDNQVNSQQCQIEGYTVSHQTDLT